MDGQQHFFGTNILVLVHRDTVKKKSRNEAKKQAWTAERDQDYKRPLKLLTCFQNGLSATTNLHSK